MLDTDRATVSATIGERAIVELPLSGRNVWNLASTTPGVSLSLDGINSSSNLLAATSMRPIADAVTEIQVQTGSTSAEYGASETQADIAIEGLERLKPGIVTVITYLPGRTNWML